MPANPDLELRLRLDAYAPRTARQALGRIDRPSPDLRDAILLMTSDLVTRAVVHRHDDGPVIAVLRAWMPKDVVRVELWTDTPLFTGERTLTGEDYDLTVLRRAADRWSAEAHGGNWCTWFEIDRQPERPAHPVPDRAMPAYRA